MPRAQYIGRVVSIKMAKTCNVLVNRYKIHPKYGTRIKRSKKFMTHDPEEKAGMYDVVKIEACRPISKRKHWRLLEILKPFPR